jgi:hypothetical protein
LTYYVREVQGLDQQQQLQIWKITDDEAICLFPSRGGLLHYRAAAGEMIWDAIRRQGAWERPDGSLPIHRLTLAPGHYFPRIARSIIQGPPSFTKQQSWQPSLANNENAIASARLQLSTLVRHLERISETVYPEESNLEAYGYDIRNLLILACTEVESHWRAVLKANGVSKDKDRWTTCDYVGLGDAMKLNEFAISFPDYPWIKPVAPFKDWDRGHPTRTLPWYDAYNAAKHDRENQLARATLRFAFDAVAACAIIIMAQFGEVFGFDLSITGRPRTFFWIRSGPAWDLADHYAEVLESRDGEEVVLGLNDLPTVFADILQPFAGLRGEEENSLVQDDVVLPHAKLEIGVMRLVVDQFDQLLGFLVDSIPFLEEVEPKLVDSGLRLPRGDLRLPQRKDTRHYECDERRKDRGDRASEVLQTPIRAHCCRAGPDSR